MFISASHGPTPAYLAAGPWSRSRSSTGSWDSTSSQGSTPDQSEVARGAWLGGQIRDRGSSSHGSVWGLYYNDDKMRMVGQERVEDVFWQDFEMSQRVLGGAELQVDKPDLLDTLVMEDQAEKKRQLQDQYQQRSSVPQLPSLENLLKLIELDKMFSHVPHGRPITGGSTQPLPPPAFKMNQSMRIINTPAEHVASHLAHVPHVFPSKFPPANFKAPPPHHPPAVPASFHLASHDTYPILPLAYSPPSLPLPGSATAIQLRVEEARWQFQSLEKERKKTEAALARQNPGKRISSSNSVQIPRLPLSPTKLDKLVNDCLREQARVVTLLDRMEKIEGYYYMSKLYESLTVWKKSISLVMAIRRKERLDNRKGSDNGEELEKALTEMSMAARKARTVLWVVMMGGSKSICQKDKVDN